MKLYAILFSLLLFVSIGVVIAQSGDNGSDTATEERVDNSSAFQDSIKYDDMDPIFYEAEEEEAAAPAQESPQISTGLIIGIVAVVVIIIIFLIRRGSSKKE